ncbi:hypothetical protein TNIN_217651 [Trichonephila inaurata madagascariensis]|uniref:Uncharacterized protein n=1 Tax=Trichonephila inaurata madagascariensis TaxID=2747483 RepID=A0A8X6WPV7_9ARAC|nr:hypothetical protein TNIN_217651 [Trichonephila inaurata madagascariensis]
MSSSETKQSQLSPEASKNFAQEPQSFCHQFSAITNHSVKLSLAREVKTSNGQTKRPGLFQFCHTIKSGVLTDLSSKLEAALSLSLDALDSDSSSKIVETSRKTRG